MPVIYYQGKSLRAHETEKKGEEEEACEGGGGGGGGGGGRARRAEGRQMEQNDAPPRSEKKKPIIGGQETYSTAEEAKMKQDHVPPSRSIVTGGKAKKSKFLYQVFETICVFCTGVE